MGKRKLLLLCFVGVVVIFGDAANIPLKTGSSTTRSTPEILAKLGNITSRPPTRTEPGNSTLAIVNGTLKVAKEGHIYSEVVTDPRYNINITKISGEWYPILLTRTAAKLWSECFRSKYPKSNASQETCFLVNYTILDDEIDNTTLRMNFSRGNQFTIVEAELIPDEGQHRSYRKWLTYWPNGGEVPTFFKLNQFKSQIFPFHVQCLFAETTVTSFVALGSLEKNQPRYTWLLVVDFDLKGVVKPDWIIFGRVAEADFTEKISAAAWDTILSIVEGISGLDLNDTLSHQQDDCKIVKFTPPAIGLRYNLNLTMIMGRWYPVMLSKTAASLWSQSFNLEHETIDTIRESCFLIDYEITEDFGDYNKTMNIKISRGNESTNVEAFLLRDKGHRVNLNRNIFSESTLTSIVAAGFLAKNQTRYGWLLVVDSDIHQKFFPDWSILARVKDGISEAALNTVFSIVEGITGLDDRAVATLNHTQSDCRGSAYSNFNE
ncbi:hypothetical protein Ocin01_15864 [Orchesella cincta]|uniref:Secreted protein n=1 Tax=Orchesella cincta TaxID=48709 RepID=A0A1D2MCU8_ORCCI|nr:hypothetical protein Ocin01_15864 [Orchesella cincta]